MAAVRTTSFLRSTARTLGLTKPLPSRPSSFSLAASLHLSSRLLNASPEEVERTLTVNPFQKSGPREEIAVTNLEEDRNMKLVRVTMPGVPRNGFKVWLDKDYKNEVFFRGVGEVEIEFEKERVYQGSVTLVEEEDDFPIEEIAKAEMRNGVLWVTLRRKFGG